MWFLFLDSVPKRWRLKKRRANSWILDRHNRYKGRVSQGIFSRQTVPPPVLPSKTKKFAIGGSRPPSAFKISCPSIPPTIAHTGENSWLAVVDRDLERKGPDLLLEWFTGAREKRLYSRRSRGSVVRTCLFTSASEIRLFDMVSSSSVSLMSSGREPWSDWNFQIAVSSKICKYIHWPKNHPPSIAK